MLTGLMVNFINPTYMEQFAHWLRESAASESTIQSCIVELRGFARWYFLRNGKKLSPEDVTKSDIEAFGKHLKESIQPSTKKTLLSSGTVWVYLEAAKKFRDWSNAIKSSEN